MEIEAKEIQSVLSGSQILTVIATPAVRSRYSMRTFRIRKWMHRSTGSSLRAETHISRPMVAQSFSCASLISIVMVFPPVKIDFFILL